MYYNEHDPYAAQWLRNLIAAGELPEGDVDERDIQDVRPDDLNGYAQCHFFAGIGGWPLALRLAGWPDGREVWTGSCPCQPFSAAGKRGGKADARHLWPQFRRLIRQCRPPTVLGEQVASADGRVWLSGVSADLEALAYRTASADLCAAGVGAPHIRQRLFWVADNLRAGWQRKRHEARGRAVVAGVGARDGGLAEPMRAKRGQESSGRHDDIDGANAERAQEASRCAMGSEASSGLGHATRERREGIGLLLQPVEPREADADTDRAGAVYEGVGDASSAGARRNGRAIPGAEATGEQERIITGRVADGLRAASADHWSDVEWVECREPNGTLVARRLESGLVPVVDGLSFLLADGRARQDAPRGQILKGIGNAIVVPLAALFVESVMEEMSPEHHQPGRTEHRRQ